MTEIDWSGVEDEAPSGPARTMDAEEQALAELIYGSIQASATETERSRQAQAFVIGVSDLGMCSERTRRVMAGVVEPDTDKLEAFIGTWIGAGMEHAVGQQHPEIKTQVEVTVQLDGDQGHYEVVGHADYAHPWGVGDGKTSDGIQVARRTGPSRQQLFQRHLLCLGLAQTGQLEVPLDEAFTYNVWLDRSGRTKEVYVHRDHFSWDVVAAATAWLDETVYAYRRGVEAEKEPPRVWCEKVCGHFLDCRAFDSDVQGLIVDERVATAAVMKRESSNLTALAKRYKKEADSILDGVNGYVRTEDGQFQIRNTWVNGSETRSGYWKISVTPMKAS